MLCAHLEKTLLCLTASPVFNEKKCVISNNQVQLSWSPMKCRVDSFTLEQKSIKGEFQLIYRGKKHENIQVDADYNENLCFRVYAENAAGKGECSHVITLNTPKGMQCIYALRDRLQNKIYRGAY